MSNTAHKFEETYKGLESYKDHNLLQSFIVSNNADAEKAIKVFEDKRNKATTPEEKAFCDEIITRYYNLMVMRLAITEDLFREHIGPKIDPNSFSKSEEEDISDRGGKTIQHPASVEQKTLNDKLREDKEVAKYLKKQDKEKEFTSHFEYLFPTEEKQTAEFLSHLPKLERILVENPTKANSYIKYIFRNSSAGLPYLTDMQILRLENWLKSDLFKWMDYHEVVKHTKFSISDIVREAEHQFIVNGLGEEEVKDLLKPYFFGKLREEKLNVNTDEQYNDTFNRIVSHVFNKELKVENQVKDAPVKEFDREEAKASFYEKFKMASNGKEGAIVAKMAKALHKMLLDNGVKSELKERVAEVKAYVAKHRATATVETPVTEESTVETTEETVVETTETTEVITEPAEEIQTTTEETTETSEEPPAEQEEVTTEETTEVETTEVEKTEEKTTTVENPSEEQPETAEEVTTDDQNQLPVDLLDKFKKQASSFSKLSSLAEYLITLVNKRPAEISAISSEDDIQAFIYNVCKDRLLTTTIEYEDGKSTADWTEKDVAEWLSTEVIPYTTGLYKILSVENDNEFKEVFKSFIEEFPAGKEKERFKKLTEIATSSYPKTKYMKAVGQKLRKNNSKYVNSLVEMTKEIYAETA